MNPYEFARAHLGEFKQHGNEIVPKYCPFCQGGPNKDKNSFALNVAKMTYNCKRGSCAEQGHFTQLCKRFGVEADREPGYENYRPVPKVYKKPETVIETPRQKVESYLKLRGFSPSTWERRRVGEAAGNICFPYYEDSKVVLVKFRKPEKYTGHGQKAWRETGGKDILWGMDLCDPQKPLVITEGEFDTLALDEAGIFNAVSVPSGAASMEWIENCWDWLEQFSKIIIWGDADDPGREMVRKVVLKLGEWRCFLVDSGRHKDANEALAREGKEKTAAYVAQAKPIPIQGLIDLADVTPVDISNIARVRSGIPGLDQEIGGFLMGELSVWTGKSGQGKSTLLGQLLLESIHQDYGVCAYSGELRADRFQYWTNLQAAGPNYIEQYFDTVKKRPVGYVPKPISSQIREWYRGKFWLYDNNILSSSPEESGIIKLFTYAARRYDCKVFLVDNLMTSRFEGGKSDSDYYRAQSTFVGDLVHFAKAYNAHVHLVAHPRKTQGKVDKESVSGSGDISNRADNVFSVERAEIGAPINTTVSILKNRSEGIQNVEIGLLFDVDCKRLWQPSDAAGMTKLYGWETQRKITCADDFGQEVKF